MLTLAGTVPVMVKVVLAVASIHSPCPMPIAERSLTNDGAFGSNFFHGSAESQALYAKTALYWPAMGAKIALGDESARHQRQGYEVPALMQRDGGLRQPRQPGVRELDGNVAGETTHRKG